MASPLKISSTKVSGGQCCQDQKRGILELVIQNEGGRKDEDDECWLRLLNIGLRGGRYMWLGSIAMPPSHSLNLLTTYLLP